MTTGHSSTLTTRAFFDGIDGPYIPDTDISPIWNPEFFRQHDDGEWQHMALPGCRTAALSAAIPQRMPVTLPDSGLQRLSQMWMCG